jgi:4-hydroxythreonine-4-phosphate dehydrogenase
VGSEVVAKALARLKPRRGVQLFLWRSPKCPTKHLRLIDSQFKRTTVSSWHEAMRIPFTKSKELIDINSVLPAAQWVELSAKAAMMGNLDGIATAPLSKTSIQQAGLQDIGHTDILKRISRSAHVHMGFVGSKFSVVLATGHIPIQTVSEQLTRERIEAAIRSAQELRSILPKSVGKLPLALIGLNPHAGETGLIGHEEQDVLNPLLEKLKAGGVDIDGPLVPDAAFLKPNWTRYSVYVSCYHDQALIPFKMIHGQTSGVHITLGLPFVRTSVDHGTAKSLFGLNKANASSMIEAIDWAIRLCQERMT